MTESASSWERPWSVKDLTTLLTDVVRQTFSDVHVCGEVSNFIRSGAGHAYFTLKDADAQIRAVIWRSAFTQIPFEIQDGLEVIVSGSLDVYAARGQYQINVRRLVPRGVGSLELAFRQLRDRLANEGMFDPRHKRPIPRFPGRVALVTSPRGAAVRDFLEVAMRRWPTLDIVICSCTVQGDSAVADILRALDAASKCADVIALVRGGGSLEDLAAFNAEPIARAIHACPIPVVSGVGHEIDVTIADLVADLRALTPSEAAERIFPDASPLRQSLAEANDRLARALKSRRDRAEELLERWLQSPTFRYPRTIVEQAARKIDDSEARLLRSVTNARQKASSELEILARSLDVVSPLAVLSRGYAMIEQEAGRKRVESIQDVSVGDLLRVHLQDGGLRIRVEGVENG